MEYHKHFTMDRKELNELLEVLLPFANMDRPDDPQLNIKTDLTEVVCERGIASDKTVITSGDFRKLREQFEKLITTPGYQ